MIGDILQPTHLLFILVIALLVLGPKRLPEAGRALGRGLRDFRVAMSGDEPDSQDDAIGAPTATAAPVAPPTPPVAMAQTAPATTTVPGTATVEATERAEYSDLIQ
jgi:sec-independent protein translocase protein TatA